ncbi:hypothetical protein Tco_0771069 [Tanacetum coccineum]|uniref:Uncharacterized protein n=1 Tax=Tanacetum coccineum TaxID=301880 RepID=A0ABQ4ZI29_9ASTR
MTFKDLLLTAQGSNTGIGTKVLRRTVGTVEQDKRQPPVDLALPNKDQLKFHSYQDAKLLMEAIKKRYGGNKESKKVQRILLKQQYKNFVALSSETMDQTIDRLQKLISHLEIQGEVINQEDMNLKLLRSLPSVMMSSCLNLGGTPDNLVMLDLCAFLEVNLNVSSTCSRRSRTRFIRMIWEESGSSMGDGHADAIRAKKFIITEKRGKLRHIWSIELV